MKVLKFGGTSVGCAASLANVKEIVNSCEESVVVVVSALGGITDALLKTASQAEASDELWKDSFEAIRERHIKLMNELMPGGCCVQPELEAMLQRLHDLYLGVYLIGALAPKTMAEIVSYGERMSSLLISEYIGVPMRNSLDFIRTIHRDGRNTLDSALSEELIRQAFSGLSPQGAKILVQGFISRDSASGEISNLGRGGSDYTAAIIAAALGADQLQIWTDVDGFMTADPRIISSSYVIDHLSYDEAMELCNFGAKVIYPPTLYPACTRNIPILIRNTFNPSAPGTVISGSSPASSKGIRGISSIDNTCLLTLSGVSMVDIVGVDRRIFTALAKDNISVFFISQGSSETGISFGLKHEDADRAKKLIDEEFCHEISEGAILPVRVDKELATVAVVGESMAHNPGVAGKLFSILGRNGISVLAIAQGSPEINISFVIERKHLRKALNVIHDGFLLSEYQELNLFICGIGTVGGQLIDQIASQREKLMASRNLKLNIVGIARSSKALFDREGIDLSDYRQRLEQEGTPIDPGKLRDGVISMNIFNSVFVDCTASASVAALYKDFFEHGVSVVTANKIAASSDYDNYLDLKKTARERGVKFLFETNVGAGLPIINTINDLVNSGDTIQKIEAVVSGTLNFIFNTLSEDIPFSKTVRLAQESGFSEPDPRIDLSGRDVIRKLVILCREAGYKVNQEDVKANLFIPQDFFDCTMEEFWQKLPSLDAQFEQKRKELAAQKKRWRFVASMENGQFSVGLREISEFHSFYVLDGSNNIVLLTTERYHQHPMLIQGYGAGASVTAAGVFADIMRIANI